MRGIAPGMDPTEVRARIGRGAVEKSVFAESGLKTSVTFPSGDVLVHVLFDGDISENPAAHVAIVRARAPEHVGDPAAFVRSIIPDLGEPVEGREHLENGLKDGVTIWKDGGCGARVTAYFKESEWWRPRQRDLFVELESIEIEAAAAPGAAAAPVVASTAAAPAGASNPPAAAKEATVGPIRTTYVAPVYPERASRMVIRASVELRVQVKSDGGVGEVEVLDTTRKAMGFEQAAIDAVKQWRYLPARRDGKAEDAVVVVRVAFE